MSRAGFVYLDAGASRNKKGTGGREMDEYVGKICPHCKTEIKEGDEVKVCPECGIPHHAACWEENKGCSTLGCREHYEEQRINSMNVCSNCGTPLEDNQAFCPKCGTQKNAPKKIVCSKCGTELQDGQEFCPKCGTQKNAPKKIVCSKCGTELQDGQKFCPKCGQKIELATNTSVSSVINQVNAGFQKMDAKKKKTFFTAAAAIAVIVVIFIAVAGSGTKGPDFNDIYDKYCSPTWASVGSDGSYLSIDTNPFDWDDDGIAFSEANTAIKKVNNALGLPDSLYSDMGETSALDGKQSETFSEQGITVTWKYHPDNGLEVTYKKAE